MTASDLLLRQIHPGFIQRGRATSQAFRPTPKDEGQLSVYNGNMIEPQPVWQHYSEVLKKASVGARAVSRDEGWNLWQSSSAIRRRLVAGCSGARVGSLRRSNPVMHHDQLLRPAPSDDACLMR